MASGLYKAAKQLFLTGALSWTSGTYKCQLVDTNVYVVDLATHDNFNDITGRVGTATTIANTTAVAAVADGDDVVFTTVSGATVEALVIFKDTGVESTSTLIAYIDSATGLPVTPSGGDITVSWNSGSNKIFAL